MAKVEFRHVAKRFGDLEVIPDLNLTIEDGEFVALLGPSGCGKSTSLLMLAGIFLPSAGDLLFDGCIVNEVEAKDRNVGIVKGFRTPASHWRAGVYGGRRPKSLEGGNRGEFAPAVVSVYGDLAPVHALIFRFRTGTTGE